MVNLQKIIQNLKRESPVDKPLVLSMIIGLPCIFLIPINIWVRVIAWLISSVLLVSFFLWKWELFDMLKVHIHAAKDISLAKKRQMEEKEQ